MKGSSLTFVTLFYNFLFLSNLVKLIFHAYNIIDIYTSFYVNSVCFFLYFLFTRAEPVPVCICPLAEPVPVCIYRTGHLSTKAE